ncbi:hypothetical protein GCM10011578_050850 [Streptomyces fuscichromogenes]|uniref:Uncharacterized protein n=1 Tax=Streptomyces fuscichromogenes TaxID=1324013 RepID=A0A918CTD9_9ACTN|nr:hypothetical protein GCM10011578_050850 [Streptomyces fuscichromogenes]
MISLRCDQIRTHGTFIGFGQGATSRDHLIVLDRGSLSSPLPVRGFAAAARNAPASGQLRPPVAYNQE